MDLRYWQFILHWGASAHTLRESMSKLTVIILQPCVILMPWVVLNLHPAISLFRTFGLGACRTGFGYLLPTCQVLSTWRLISSLIRLMNALSGTLERMSKIWGTPDIDIFASRLNSQLPKYASWKPDPGATHVDAFSFAWTWMFIYIFPPFCLIARCLKKLESDWALALMVVSLWPTQTWGPQLLSLLIASPVILPQHKDLLTLPHNGMKHPLKTKLRMVVCLLSGSSIKRKEFHNQLPTCCWPPGEGAPKYSTMCTSKNGPSLVLKGKLINFSHLL